MGRRAYGMKRNDYNNDDYDDDKNNFMFAEVRTNRPRCIVTHTDQSNERFL
jgi:hypothetical protein